MLFHLYEIIIYHLLYKSRQVVYILQGAKIATAIDFLFCVLLLTSLVAVGEAKGVYSARAPRLKGGMPILPSQTQPKWPELWDYRSQTRRPLPGNCLSPAQTQQKHVDGLKPQFPLFLMGYFKIRNIWLMNEWFPSKKCSSTGSLLSVHVDPIQLI